MVSEDEILQEAQQFKQKIDQLGWQDKETVLSSIGLIEVEE